jgi:DNA-binding NtrC family response regulator
MTITIFHLDDEIQILDQFKKIFKKKLLGLPTEILSFRSADEIENAVAKKPDVDIFIIDALLGQDLEGGVKLAAKYRRIYPSSLIFVCSISRDLKTIHESLRSGANDFISKDLTSHEIFTQIETSLANRRTHLEHPPNITSNYVGSLASKIKLRIPNIIDSAVNCIYVEGESGTGKEVVANLVQEMLPRVTPFVRVNCGAIAPTLIVSELFGHTKGSFTGATTDKAGLLEAANNGWIFLDEISTLPIDAQVALLRAIDNQTIRRVGSTGEKPIIFRVISASNESLSHLVDQGKFRRDLWQRLREAEILLPALRERKNEIPDLVDLFCRTMRGGPYRLAPTVLDVLSQYDWHEGNIRELRNCLRAMTENSINQVLTPSSIPSYIWKSLDQHLQGYLSHRSDEQGLDEQTLSINWTAKTRPSFEILTELLLLKVLRQEFAKNGRMSMRALAKSCDVPKSSMPIKIKNILKSGLILKSELTQMINLGEDDSI